MKKSCAITSYTETFKADKVTYSKRNQRSSQNNEDCFNLCLLFNKEAF